MLFWNCRWHNWKWPRTFYLEEKNILSQKYQPELEQSKVFSAETTVKDFPLNGKPVLFHLKGRRCTLVNTSRIVKIDWELVAKSTRITSEFAHF